MTVIDDDIEFARFRQRLQVRVGRARLGIDLPQDTAQEILDDPERARTYYDQWQATRTP